MLKTEITCKSLCGNIKPCGNVFCSLNPKYRGPFRKKKKPKPYKSKQFRGFIPKGRRVWCFNEKGGPV